MKSFYKSKITVKLLPKIHSPKELRTLNIADLECLAEEMRSFIIENVSRLGGHLGASLGTIEISIALHYAFNTPHDLLVWDVGHQAYGHKILTGRRDSFNTLRQLGGISGFPKISESIYDNFGTGHSSTSISAILGMAIADRINGVNRQHVAVIGDASMQAGMAFEALNHAGVEDTNLLIILNDNCMSIDPSVGALNAFLEKATKVFENKPDIVFEQLQNKYEFHENNLFDDLGIRYFGPTNGHDIANLLQVFEELKNIQGPKVLHVLTKKGKGFLPAETGNATFWHAPSNFDPSTGKVLHDKSNEDFPKFQDVFGKTMLDIASQNTKVVGITPAMPSGSSLHWMLAQFPERCFDVGIAEQHAVTLSAGMASNKLVPFCVIYSTFLQRGYDQLIHDVAIQNLKVIFCVDRAGLVGADGATHHGLYDIAYLRCVPNIQIAVPANGNELREMMLIAQSNTIQGPVAIRYPRGKVPIAFNVLQKLNVEWGKALCLKEGETVAILAIGPLVYEALHASEQLKKANVFLAVYNMRFVKPVDTDLLIEIAKKYSKLITLEDGSLAGGFGEYIASELLKLRFSGEFYQFGVPDKVIEHGSPDELYTFCELNADSIAKRVKMIMA